MSGAEPGPVPLLDNAALLASETVSNARMNRDRGLSGVNSYDRDLRTDIPALLRERVERNGRAVWYDACCGTGRALREAAERGARESWGEHVTLLGVDLWDDFTPPAGGEIRFVAADVVRFDPQTPVDLVTCVHGIHYLGDKLAFLENAYALLAPGGVFVGHLDPTSLRCEGAGKSGLWTRLLRRVRATGAAVIYRNHLIHMEKTRASLRFGARYIGARAAELPNFSGMVGVDSWYEEPA